MKRSLPEEIVKFQDISNLYDVYFVDLWGVIHNGINLFDNAIYVLKKLKEKEKKIVFSQSKEIIIWHLSEEIVKRNFYREGVYQYSLLKNTAIQEAKSILKDSSRYYSLLK